MLVTLINATIRAVEQLFIASCCTQALYANSVFGLEPDIVDRRFRRQSIITIRGNNHPLAPAPDADFNVNGLKPDASAICGDAS